MARHIRFCSKHMVSFFVRDKSAKYPCCCFSADDNYKLLLLMPPTRLTLCSELNFERTLVDDDSSSTANSCYYCQPFVLFHRFFFFCLRLPASRRCLLSLHSTWRIDRRFDSFIQKKTFRHIIVRSRLHHHHYQIRNFIHTRSSNRFLFKRLDINSESHR